jgi:putative FmdB family regulatory protein
MPVYEYFCKKCGEFEVTQRITEPPLARCPSCRGKVKKLISATSFQLKGSGWYVTDYARKGSAAKDGAPSSTPATSENKSTESKSTDTSSSKTETSTKTDSGSGPTKDTKAAA